MPRDIYASCGFYNSPLVYRGSPTQWGGGYSLLTTNMDSEESELMHFRTHFECWISFLYRIYDRDLVLNNPYSVVYEFELV